MPSCPALLVSAPASGQGKTAVTAALARLHSKAGRRVRVFKCGPDFLDPMIHARASTQPCENLDLFMGGATDCARRLAEAAAESDLILVEGVMGLFDGQPSAADIAQQFHLPVLAVLDARAMAQTFGALALGLAQYRPDLPFAGVLANRIGSARHAELLRSSLPSGLDWYGALPRETEAILPERHLGLWQADEIPDLLRRLDALAERLQDTALTCLPPVVDFATPAYQPPPALLAGVRIAIARDAAFAFIYPANLQTLRELGAELLFFSPLAGDALPDCDALWLPGGYPELHLNTLAAHTRLLEALRHHHAAGKPILAECGGMLYLCESLTDTQGQQATLAGLLPGHAQMHKRRAALGMQRLTLPDGELRGHSFHYSSLKTPLSPTWQASRAEGGMGEPVYQVGRLTASYLHSYFPSNPKLLAQWFLP